MSVFNNSQLFKTIHHASKRYVYEEFQCIVRPSTAHKKYFQTLKFKKVENITYFFKMV